MRCTTRVVAKLGLRDEIQCNVCGHWKEARTYFGTDNRTRSGGGSPTYQTQCNGCKAVARSLRVSLGGGKYKHPSKAEIVAAVNSGVQVPVSVKLVTPAHPKRSTGRMSAKERRLAAQLRKAREERIAKEPKRQGHVYLIGEKGHDYAVKIGHSTDTRLAELQTGNPRELVLLGTIPGSTERERELHAKYIGQNTMLEWFRPTPELLSEFDVEEGSPLD